MHVLAGIISMIAAFALANLAHHELPFGGLFNPAAMVLLGLGPLAASMISHPFREWRSMARILGRAFGHDRDRSLQHASEDLARVARAVRESRWDEVERGAAEARAEQVRNLAPHLLGQYDTDGLRDAVATTAFRWMAEVKGADDFLQGLARLSPAFGMIGTIMGLVDLFRNMRDSASLGPGMAMALLATLYGLVLCYCVYMPLSQRVRTYLAAGTAELRMVERGLAMIQEGRTVHEVRSALLEGAVGAARAPANGEGLRP